MKNFWKILFDIFYHFFFFCTVKFFSIKNSDYYSFSFFFFFFQQIITQCTNCTSCKSGLKEVLNYLLNFAEHSKIWLIVMVRGTHEADMLPKMDFTSRLRVVFVSDEVQVAVTDCQVVDEADTDTFRSFSKTSVLFVSVSFIILMVVSLAWLIIYYVQRLVSSFSLSLQQWRGIVLSSLQLIYSLKHWCCHSI